MQLCYHADVIPRAIYLFKPLSINANMVVKLSVQFFSHTCICTCTKHRLLQIIIVECATDVYTKCHIWHDAANEAS